MAKTSYKQGFFKPTNPAKYKGDPSNIVYRSGWELRVMKWLDSNINVTLWSSEEIIIPYRSPVDGRIHRYFPDFYVETIGKEGTKKIYLIEVKPQAQTQKPKKPKRQTKRYLQEVFTYGTNQSKWDAAKAYCTHKGWEFKILTEKGYQDHV